MPLMYRALVTRWHLAVEDFNAEGRCGVSALKNAWHARSADSYNYRLSSTRRTTTSKRRRGTKALARHGGNFTLQRFALNIKLFATWARLRRCGAAASGIRTATRFCSPIITQHGFAAVARAFRLPR